MPYTDLFGTDCQSMGGIKTLKLATRDDSDNPLDFPLDFQLKVNDESIIVLSDDEATRTIVIGGVNIQYRMVIPLYSSFKEEEVTDRQGRFYKFTLTFQIPKLTLTTNNQLKNFLWTDSGNFAISNTVAFIEDLNGVTWILGYDLPLILEAFDLTTGVNGEDNMYTLTYVGKSYNRIRKYELI